MPNNTLFLLLPGGGMSSWIWEKLIPLLSLKAITPEYRLHENTYANRLNATINDIVQYHLSLIKANNADKLIVVGHSGAGILAAALAKAVPEKIRHVVYVSANIPANHKSALDALPFFIKAMNKNAIKKQAARDSHPLKDKEEFIRKYFCNTCPDEVVSFVLSHDLLSEPLCAALEKVNWDDFPQVDQTYIVLTRDKTQSVKQQEKMMRNLGIKNTREISSDHMVMLGKPGELAEMLNSFTKD
jgi:pimeloyl-ACP methyl ester carboxylesterase